MPRVEKGKKKWVRGVKRAKKKQVERVCKKQKAGRGEEVGGRRRYGIKVERKIFRGGKKIILGGQIYNFIYFK
jgi:hypothetical protein